ncbi:MAG: kelch repeat-containing protein [Planctomycetota bacterium]
MIPNRCSPVVGLVPLLVAALPAQVEWSTRHLHGRWSTAVAFDVARGRLVEFHDAFSAYEAHESVTWEWDRARWTRGPDFAAGGPPPRVEHAMCYDPVRGVALLFGGTDELQRPRDDTWAWDGATWTELSPPVSPPRMRQHALTFDLARGRAVLFGLGQTWEWDGATWLRNAIAGPPVVRQHAMVYDVLRGRTVLFGGASSAGVLNGQTWTYDGAAWTANPTAVAPSARTQHAMAYDLARGRVVLFGGLDGSGLPDATWEWDGVGWAQVAAPTATTPGPAPRVDAGMAYDPGTGLTLLTGGVHPTLPFADQHGELWAWDGVSWRVLDSAQTPGRAVDFRYSKAAYDSARDRLVMWSAEQWEWDGERWYVPDRITAVRPQSDYGLELVYDEARQRVVFCGSQLLSGVPVTLWEWDGSQWTATVPQVAPPPRRDMAVGRDSLRRRLVLFGGSDNVGEFDDTWEWDGINWREVVPAARPSPRLGARMAFDRARGEMVLHGGERLSQFVDETWTWDGAVWRARPSTARPPRLLDPELYYDEARRRVVLLGPSNGGNEAWDWDGQEWARRAPLGAPTLPTHLVGAYDSRRGRFVAWTSSDGQRVTRTFGPVHAASATPFGGNCAGSAGPVTLGLTGAALPWLGDTIEAVVTPAPTPGLCLLWFSASNTNWGGVPLPLALGPFGMPGCTVDVAIDATLLTAPVAGTASFALQVPNDPALLGGEAHLQAAVADPGVNPAGIVPSHGLTLRLGGR